MNKKIVERVKVELEKLQNSKELSSHEKSIIAVA